MCPRATLDTVLKKKIPSPDWEVNPDHPVDKKTKYMLISRCQNAG